MFELPGIERVHLTLELMRHVVVKTPFVPNPDSNIKYKHDLNLGIITKLTYCFLPERVDETVALHGPDSFVHANIVSPIPLPSKPLLPLTLPSECLQMSAKSQV